MRGDRPPDAARYRELLGPAADGLTDEELLRGVEGLAQAAPLAGTTTPELASQLGRGAVELQAWSRRGRWRVMEGGADDT